MKVQEFRDLIDEVWQQFTSCRGCRLEERPAEIQRLVLLVRQLEGVECFTAKDRDLRRAGSVINQAKEFITKFGPTY